MKYFLNHISLYNFNVLLNFKILTQIYNFILYDFNLFKCIAQPQNKYFPYLITLYDLMLSVFLTLTIMKYFVHCMIIYFISIHLNLLLNHIFFLNYISGNKNRLEMYNSWIRFAKPIIQLQIHNSGLLSE